MRVASLFLGLGLILPLALPASATEPSRPQPSGFSFGLTQQPNAARQPAQRTTRAATTQRRQPSSVTSPRDVASGQATGRRQPSSVISPRDSASGLATAR